MTIKVSEVGNTLKPGTYGDATIVAPANTVGALLTVNIVSNRLKRLLDIVEKSQQAKASNDAARDKAYYDQHRQLVEGIKSAGAGGNSRGIFGFGGGGGGSSGGGGGGGVIESAEGYGLARTGFAIAKFMPKLIGPAIALGITQALVALKGDKTGQLGKQWDRDFFNPLRNRINAANKTSNDALKRDQDAEIAPKTAMSGILQLMGFSKDHSEMSLSDLNAWIWKSEDPMQSWSGSVTRLRKTVTDVYKSVTDFVSDHEEQISRWFIESGLSFSKYMSNLEDDVAKSLHNFNLAAMMKDFLQKFKDWIHAGIMGGGGPITPGNNGPNLGPGSNPAAEFGANSGSDMGAKLRHELHPGNAVGGSMPEGAGRPEGIGNFRDGSRNVGGSMPEGAGRPEGIGHFTSAAVGGPGFGTLNTKLANGQFGPVSTSDLINGTGGGQATAGGKTSPGIVNLAQIMAADANFPGGFGTVTGLNDGYHAGSRSKHAQGFAADFTLKDGSRAAYEAANQYINDHLVKAGLQPGKDFWIEPTSGTFGPGSTAKHIHVQFQNGDAAARYSSWAAGDPAAQKAMGTMPPEAIPKTTPAQLFPKGNFTGRTPTAPVADPANVPVIAQGLRPDNVGAGPAIAIAPNADAVPSAVGTGFLSNRDTASFDMGDMEKAIHGGSPSLFAKPDPAPTPTSISERMGGGASPGPTEAPAIAPDPGITARSKMQNIDAIPTVHPDAIFLHQHHGAEKDSK